MDKVEGTGDQVLPQRGSSSPLCLQEDGKGERKQRWTESAGPRKWREEAPDGLVFFNLVSGLLRTGEGCVSFAGKVNGRRTAERTMGGANQG